jgi:hypothetical protein
MVSLSPLPGEQGDTSGVGRGDGQVAQLSPRAQEWALAHSGESMVARVALQGYGAGWPDEHVTAAIKACNEKGTQS